MIISNLCLKAYQKPHYITFFISINFQIFTVFCTLCTVKTPLSLHYQMKGETLFFYTTTTNNYDKDIYNPDFFRVPVAGNTGTWSKSMAR